MAVLYADSKCSSRLGVTALSHRQMPCAINPNLFLRWVLMRFVI